MRFFLSCILLLCTVFPAAKVERRVEYRGEIPHFFTHCLLAYPEIALGKSNPMARHYDADCITYGEFTGFLQEVYRNGYVLADIRKLYERNGESMTEKPLLLPPGKKPLLLSFDDVIYDRKKSGLGMVDKLVLDGNGEPAALTASPPCGESLTYDREFVPILERFIASHPDFSPDGARGTLFVTGYDGILGYRTDRDSKTRQRDTESVKPVIETLLARGWTFGCHGYGHYHMNARTEEQLRSDTAKWRDEVEPLTGPTDLYAYPYGEWDHDGASVKQRSLEEAGFHFFLGVGTATYFKRANRKYFMDRQPLDGLSLRKYKEAYRSVFDADRFFTR